jgi:hypothetical protein
MATSTRDLLTGLAQMIADTGIAVYRPTGVYQPGETGVTFKASPQNIDRCIMLMCVPITDGAMVPMGRWMVQAYVRGLPNDPMDVEDLGDAVFDLWQGATNITLGSTHAIQILRQGSVGNGQDDSKRWTRIDRYLLDLDVAPTVNRPANGWD